MTRHLSYSYRTVSHDPTDPACPKRVLRPPIMSTLASDNGGSEGPVSYRTIGPFPNEHTGPYAIARHPRNRYVSWGFSVTYSIVHPIFLPYCTPLAPLGAGCNEATTKKGTTNE